MRGTITNSTGETGHAAGAVHHGQARPGQVGRFFLAHLTLPHFGEIREEGEDMLRRCGLEGSPDREGQMENDQHRLQRPSGAEGEETA